MKKCLIAAGCGWLGLAATSQAALVASWTFDAGNATGLTSTNGLYTFTPRAASATNPTLAYNSDGTVSLGSGEQLFANAINALTCPRSAITRRSTCVCESTARPAQAA